MVHNDARLTTFDGLGLPRRSKDMAPDGPGVVVASAVGAVPALTDLRIGDVLSWDATDGGDEEAGEADHVGVYMGLDVTGLRRFISSRKTINGPTISDLAGPSVVGEATGLYSTRLRTIRRY